jgi:hypothetical protein
MHVAPVVSEGPGETEAKITVWACESGDVEGLAQLPLESVEDRVDHVVLASCGLLPVHL